jgi:hypothetical protein
MKVMKLYKHTFNDYRNVIETVEIEVEEKPKTYVIVSKQKGVWESRVSKDDIDKLDRHWDRKMFTLSPDRKPYINALIADKETDINRLKNTLEKAVGMKTVFLELLRKEQEGK